jgi:hypothetical protein
MKKKFKSVPSAAKIIVTVFWDDKGVTLVNFLPWGQQLTLTTILKH